MTLSNATSRQTLRHDSEDGVVAADAGAVLLIVLLGVADLKELGRGGQHRASKPHGVALHVMCYYLHLHGLGLQNEPAHI